MHKLNTNVEPVDFPSRIKYLRLQLGLNKCEFYDRLYETQDPKSIPSGIKSTTVGRWESGEVMPQADSIVKIANALGCDIDYLFGRIKEKTHTIEFIHQELGMPPSFIEKLIAVKNSPRQPSLFDLFNEGGTDIMLVLLESIYNNTELMTVLREYLDFNNSGQIELKTTALSENGIQVPDFPSDTVPLPVDSSSSISINGCPLDASYFKQGLIHKIQNALDKMDIRIPKENSEYYDSSRLE